MSSMQMGTQMVKLRGGSKGLVRFFYLDEHKSCIRWRPSRKNEKAKSKCVCGRSSPENLQHRGVFNVTGSGALHQNVVSILEPSQRSPGSPA